MNARPKFSYENTARQKHSNFTYSKEAIKALLDGGADPNVKDNMGMTPLYVAMGMGIRHGNASIDVVKILFEGGANPNIPDNYFKYTPLYMAV